MLVSRIRESENTKAEVFLCFMNRNNKRSLSVLNARQKFVIREK